MRNDSPKTGIDYPCQWTFRVIGRDRDGVRAALEAAAEGRAYLLLYANSSSGGKYHSWNIELTVTDEAERNALFLRFRALPSVVMVI